MTVNQTAAQSKYKPGAPGYAFKNGRLYKFDFEDVCILEHPRDLRCWTKSVEKPFWRSSRMAADYMLLDIYEPPPPMKFDEDSLDFLPTQQVTAIGMHNNVYELPDGQFVWPFFYENAAEIRAYFCKKAYLEQFPQDLLALAFQFDSRRYQVLSVLLRCKGADELCRSNPALLYALANNWVFRKPAVKKPLNAVRRLLPKSQKKILAWLGFPPTASVRKIFSRIRPESVSIEYLLYLRNSLKNETCLKWLQHTPRINRGVLRLVNDQRYHMILSPTFLSDLGQNEDNDCVPNILHTIRDTLRMADWHQEVIPLPFRTLEQLETVHDRVSHQYAHRAGIGKNLKTLAFPDPPLPGTPNVLPITDYYALELEGETQKNCVVSYIHQILERKTFIYHVRHPVPATLSVKKARSGEWKIDQLLAERNKPIPTAARNQILNEFFNN